MRLIDQLMQPTPAVMTIVSACLIVLMFGVFIEDEETIEDTKNINKILNRIQKKQQRMTMTNKHRHSDANKVDRISPLTKPSKEKGLSVRYENDKLVVNQKIKIIRNVLIMNSDQSLIIKHKLKDTSNSISIDKFAEDDSVRVIIETIGTIVFDDWIRK